MMPIVTMITGVILVGVGVFGYTNQEPNPETGKVSMTALIPAIVGGLLLVLGILALSPGLRKHAMHFAAMVGLVGLLGGFMPIIRQIKNSGSFDPLKPSALAGEAMILVCAVFVALCVKSFIAAKKARKAREAAGVVTA